MSASTLWVEEGGLWAGKRGDPTQPFSTLGQAFAAAESGDVVRIGPGVFKRAPNETQIAKSLSIVGSGMHATTLTTDYVSSKPGEIYTLLGSHEMERPDTRLEIRDLTIDCNGHVNIAAGSRQQALQAVAEEIYLSRIQVRGCVAEGAGVEVFGLAAHGKRIAIVDCHVVNDQHAYLTGIMAGGGHGWGGTESVVVRGCTVDGLGHTHSIGLGMGLSNNVTATGNVFLNVTRGLMCDTGGVRNVVASGNVMRGVPGSLGVYLAYFDMLNVRLEGNVIEAFDVGVNASRATAGKVNKAQRIDGLVWRANSFVGCRKKYVRN